MSDRYDRTWADYSARFRTEVMPRILSSGIMLHVVGDGDAGAELDVRAATELGAMLLMGRPLILVSTPGSSLPAGLRRAADVVLEDWNPDDEASQAQLADALRRIGGAEPS